MSNKNYLFSYILATGGSGTASYTYSAGIDIDSWSKTELNGNEAFIVSTHSSVNGYKNINSICNWSKYGKNAGLRHGQIHEEVENEWNGLTMSGLTWSGLTVNEKKCLSSRFIVDKSFRDEVYTDAEQEVFDHYVIYHHLSLDAEYKLGNYSMKTTPKSIDYKRDLDIRLQPKYTFDVHGWLTECEYFESVDVATDSYGFHIFNYSNPVLKYVATYNIDTDGYVSDRTINRSWFLMSGSYSTDTKTSHKVYGTLEARAEGRRRRKNLINNLLIDTVGLIIMSSVDLNNVSEAETDGISFMNDIGPSISAYYESGAKKDSLGNPCSLIQIITTHTYSRLDNWVPGTGNTVSIRAYIINRLDPQ